MRRYIFLCLSVLLFWSCRDRDFNFEDKYIPPLNGLERDFSEQFAGKYGRPAKTVTWMTAVSDTAFVDMSLLDKNVHYTVRFYTSNPISDNQNSFLLAEYKDLVPSIDLYELPFDRPLGLNEIYITTIDPSGIGYTVRANMSAGWTRNITIVKALPNSIPDRPAMRYTIGFEGLTAEGLDFDYNDVVLELEYVRGRKDVRVVLKAAGNSCNTRVVYRTYVSQKKYHDEELFEETHAAIGYPAIYNFATDKNIYYILNTGINDSQRTAETSVTLTEDEGKSICDIAPNFISFFKIDDKEKGEGESYFLPNYQGCIHPEALLLAVPDWNWSPEGMAIHVQHLDFKKWVTMPELYPLWYTDVWTRVNER